MFIREIGGLKFYGILRDDGPLDVADLFMTRETRGKRQYHLILEGFKVDLSKDERVLLELESMVNALSETELLTMVLLKFLNVTEGV